MIIRKLFINVIRDNKVANWLGRRLVKSLIKFAHPPDKWAKMYRIFGTVKLKIGEVEFKIYSEADDHIANGLYYCLGYEDDEFRLVKHLIIQSKYLIDVGANTGIFSIYAALVKPELKVLSFEPHPSNYNRFRTNVLINNLGNVEAYENAVGRDEKEIEFTVPVDLSISATTSANDAFTRNFHNLDFKKIAVQQKRLDDVLADIPLTSADVIKIDVEYYELEVLKGAESTLRNKRPMIIIELLDYNDLVTQFPFMEGRIGKTHAGDIVRFLTDLSYHAYSIAPDGLHDAFLEKKGRNFLFIPFKLPVQNVAFQEVLALMESGSKE